MHDSISRRSFLRAAVLAGAGWSVHSSGLLRAAGANSRVRLAFIGVNSRGTDLIKSFMALDGVEAAWICDVDKRALAKGLAAVALTQKRAPKTTNDLRRVLDDPEVDAVVIAAPDHWHAPAAILACQAGKHVYVEKPASHNPQEGEWMVAAARKYRRVVQLGTQRRSMPAVREAMQRLKEGVIGRVTFSKGWYTNQRGGIGRGHAAPVPDWLDYALWQGPAPEKPYRDNLIHYNWHWFWHWGTGELGNNGIHALDLCRWGLGVTHPQRVVAAGARYRFADDQESPDTVTVSYEFPGCGLTWEGRSCDKHVMDGSGFGASFYGEGGVLMIDGSNYTIYDLNDKQIARVQGPGDDRPHLRNFLDCVVDGGTPNADIGEGHLSTQLCHLGNIAWRTRSSLDLDAGNGRVLHNKAAMRLWRRDYRPGWTPKV